MGNGFGVSRKKEKTASTSTITVFSGVITPGDYSIELPDSHAIGMSPNYKTIVPISYNSEKMRDVVWEPNTYGYLPPGMRQEGTTLDRGASVNVVMSDAFFRNSARGEVQIERLDFRGMAALSDPVGTSLMRSLGAMADGGDAQDWPLLMDTIGASLALRLMQVMGANVRISRLPTGRMSRVMDYINDHLDRVLTLDELSQVAGLSMFHFARQFKRETGESPHEYVLRTRVAKAVSLARIGATPLSIIALACGFSSQAHMTKAIKAKTGATPGQHQRDAGVKRWKQD